MSLQTQCSEQGRNNMEFNGTPRAWYVSNEGLLLVRDESDDSVIASGIGCAHNDDEMANANLISAAPDLLEALIEMQRNGRKQGWNDNYWSSMEKTRRAINKALGGDE